MFDIVLHRLTIIVCLTPLVVCDGMMPDIVFTMLSDRLDTLARKTYAIEYELKNNIASINDRFDKLESMISDNLKKNVIHGAIEDEENEKKASDDRLQLLTKGIISKALASEKFFVRKLLADYDGKFHEFKETVGDQLSAINVSLVESRNHLDSKLEEIYENVNSTLRKLQQNADKRSDNKTMKNETYVNYTKIEAKNNCDRTLDSQVCFEPPVIPNGILSIRTISCGVVVAHLTCNPGYAPASSLTSVRCSYDTGWGDVTAISCASANDSIGYFGKSFVTAYMMNFKAEKGSPFLMIACPYTATIRVEIPFLDLDEVHHVQTSMTLKYPSSLVQEETGTTDYKAVFVTSDIPVMVFSANMRNSSSDGSIVLPRSVLSNEYFIAGYPSSSNGKDQFTVISLNAGTRITIDYNYNSKPTETLILNENQTYFIQDTDLSGTRILASNPVFVLSSHKCANIPKDSVLYCDYLDETAPPVSSLGTSHIVSNMEPRTDFTISVVITQDSTTVEIYDIHGDRLEIILDLSMKKTIYRTYRKSSTISVMSDKPIMVHQYGHGSEKVSGDPSMMFVPDVGFYGAKYDFMIPTEMNADCTLAIVISEKYSVSSLKLNHQTLTPTKKLSITVPRVGRYNVVYADVKAGYNTLNYAPGVATFGAWLYGRTPISEFSWTLGYAVQRTL